MKKIIKFIYCIFFIIYIILLINCIVVFSVDKFYYAEEFIVTNLDFENNLVFIETSTGIIFTFYEIEDWSIDDHCTCLMFNNFTKQIFDDKIINVKYCGF